MKNDIGMNIPLSEFHNCLDNHSDDSFKVETTCRISDFVLETFLDLISLVFYQKETDEDGRAYYYTGRNLKRISRNDGVERHYFYPTGSHYVYMSEEESPVYGAVKKNK